MNAPESMRGGNNIESNVPLPNGGTSNKIFTLNSHSAIAVEIVSHPPILVLSRSAVVVSPTHASRLVKYIASKENFQVSIPFCQ